MAKWVKNPPAMQKTQEMWVQFLGGEDSLEEGMATHCSILAWRIPWTEELWWAIVHAVAESDMTERLMLSLSYCFLQWLHQGECVGPINRV